MDSSSSNHGSENRIIREDLERNNHEKNPKPFTRAWRTSVNVSKSYLFPHFFKALACIMTALCIFQFIWLRRIQSGLVRVPNDPFDVTFYEVLHRNRDAVWDNDRQSFIQSVTPVPVHSHNDYLQRIPLFEALGSGCISVEADVHLQDSDLLIGHDSSSLRKDSTLRSMYLGPLQRMIEKQNADITNGTWRGVFHRAPQQTFVLLIDHKTAGPETFAVLDKQLQPLRDLDYLTYWNGTERVMRPLTIVASGNAPFESVMALNASHRDIFWDAPLSFLGALGDHFDTDPPIFAFNQSNSYFASTQWHNARLFAPHDDFSSVPLTAKQDAEMTQIEQAKVRGLVARYWDVPTHPPNLRDIAWRVLVERKVGILNMDDMGAVRARASGWGEIQV